MPKSKSKIDTDTPTLFDLKIVTNKPKKIHHPDEVDSIGDDFPTKKQCNHPEKMPTKSGWLCYDCFTRWDDVGEDWAIARLQSLKYLRSQYEGKQGKRFDDAIAEIDVERDELLAKYVRSPVSSPVELTGELKPNHWHWVEEYGPKKGRFYFRYCYSPNRVDMAKKIHIPGGNNTSPIALSRKGMIEAAISNGKSYAEITALIRSFL